MAPLCLLRGALRTTPRLSQAVPTPGPAVLPLAWAAPGHGHPAGPARPRPAALWSGLPGRLRAGVRGHPAPPPVPSGLSPCPATRSWRGSVWRGHALAGMMAIPHRVENLWTN